jgi:putative peptide zinc metalloprotease protein
VTRAPVMQPDPSKDALAVSDAHQRPLGRIRFDLRLRKHRHQDEFWGVVKDPVSLRYVRVPWQDIELGRYYDGVRTARQIARAWLEDFAELRLAGDEDALTDKALRLHADLAVLGFVEVDGGQALAMRLQRAEARRRGRGLKFLFAWLFMRRSLWDPDPVLERITPWFRWVFRWWFQVLTLALVVAATAVLLSNLSEIRFDMGWFLSWQNLLGLYIGFFLMKTIHEFGHGVACKHYGGEVHEMGVMLFAFQPFFYVNVSDAWMLPQKSRRIIVAAAGMWVELALSALLIFLWFLLAPGYWRDLVLAVVAIAGLTTVITNANPLMKLDGYYILSDLLEVPNLRDKASRMIGRQLRKLLYGRKIADAVDPALTVSRRGWTLLVYSVCSFLYIVVLLWHVVGRIDHLFDAFGLRFLAHMLVVGWVAGFLVVPIAMFFRRTHRALPPDALASTRRPRRVGLAMAALLLTVALLPWPRYVRRSCVLEPAAPDLLRAQVAGFIREVHVREGDIVQPGQLVAVLENPMIASDIVSVREQIARAESELQKALAADRSPDYAAAERLRDASRARLADLERRAAQLELRASIAGRVLTRDIHLAVGRYLDQGDTLGAIASADELTFLMPLDEKDARFVRSGQPATLKVRSFPGLTFRGVVTQNPLRAGPNDLPAGLAAQRGGDVAMTQQTDGSVRLLRAQFFSQFRIEGENLPLRPGMTGRVRVHCGRSTVWRLVLQRLLDFINLDYQL